MPRLGARCSRPLPFPVSHEGSDECNLIHGDGALALNRTEADGDVSLKDPAFFAVFTSSKKKKKYCANKKFPVTSNL
jgi:hypothetical protein